MRDESFFLEPAARQAAEPPFSYRFVERPWPARGWSVREGRDREVGSARTRRGAQAAVRALYAAAKVPN